jgi:hypothetical protein
MELERIGDAEAGLLPPEVWSRFNSKLPPVFPFRVQNAEDKNAPAFDAIEEFVRKSAREQTAKIAIIKKTTFGVGFQQANSSVNFNQEFIT